MDERATGCAELVQRAASGDRDAFARLIGMHERQALAVAFATVGCAATAADVVQDAMLRAWQRLAELDEPQRFAPWLCRIVRNLAVDAIRRKPRADLVDAEQLSAVPATGGGDAIEQTELRQRINDSLAGLDDLTRLAVTLRYYEGLSSKQIGDLVELSPAAIDMRLSRARGVLREKLACVFNPDAAQCASGGGERL